jgi:transcriptional regulator with XRE-family HTH domain
MNGMELRDVRLASSWTQTDAALKLGVTQAYLSMVERGARPVSRELAARATRVFEVPPAALPFNESKASSKDELFFKEALGSLGYPGFAYLGGSERMNPAELLLEALDCDDLDSRVVEALPWVPLAYSKLNWDWLYLRAKTRDRQNRLAYVVDLARQIATRKQNRSLADPLAKYLEALERSRLAGEDTLCKDSMTAAERKWLRVHRSRLAKHWNLLTDLSVEQLAYAAIEPSA